MRFPTLSPSIFGLSSFLSPGTVHRVLGVLLMVLLSVTLTASMRAQVIDLSTLDGTNGFRLEGIDDGDVSGVSVSGAGDVNGDGTDDLIIGAYAGYDPSTFGPSTGESYVVFGTMSGFPASIDLSTLDGTNGFRLDGIDDGDRSGYSVSGAGDVNGDGTDDLIIGAPGADPGSEASAGESYVVFGTMSGFPASFDLSTLDGTNGFRLDGIDDSDYFGWSVSGAGDVNGDGVDDIIIGAPLADPGGIIEAGQSYVVFGTMSGFPASFDLSTLDGTNGFRLDGIDDSDYFGWSVSGAGDVNGDGVDDIIIGARHDDVIQTLSDGLAGTSYVVFGTMSGFPASMDLSTLDGSNGFIIPGIDDGDFSGISVSGAGDVNDDGTDDIIIGASRADPGGDREGESYVVFGKRSGFAASMDLSTLDGSNGFRLDGIDANDRSGTSVSGAGDVNGDGVDDIIIGALFADPGGDALAGESYVVFGKRSGFAASMDLSTLDGSNGFRLDGIDPDDRSGVSVSGAGDVNGDGTDDLIIGAYQADPGGDALAGESYVVLGTSVPTGVAVEHVDGVPEVFALGQNYPNPFNPSTTIRYDLPQAASVVLTVYNLMGQEVVRLVSGDYPAGRYATNWDATGVASGVYIYQLRAGSYIETKKLLLLK